MLIFYFILVAVFLLDDRLKDECYFSQKYILNNNLNRGFIYFNPCCTYTSNMAEIFSDSLYSSENYFDLYYQKTRPEIYTISQI